MIEAGARAYPFELQTLEGARVRVDAGEAAGPVLLAFFATDCPTCQLSVPYLDKLAGAVAPGGGRVVGISQDGPEATKRFIEQTGARFPIVLDRKLVVSREYDPEAVPTLILIGRQFDIESTHIGFSKTALNALGRDLAQTLGLEPTTIAEEHDGAPATKPGCGSRHREPGMEEGGAEPEAQGIYVRRGPKATRIDVPDDIDLYEYMERHGFSDPLPVVPPTAERVDKFLAATDLDPQEVVGLVPPNYGMATVEKIAANAVMAGCFPEMMKALIPMVRAMCDEKFNLHGVTATTHFAAPLMVINGPVRDELGFHSKKNVFSNIARANSTLGRAFQLVHANIGGGGPRDIDMSTLGNPGKFSYCIAENEEENPWQPLSADQAFEPGRSTLTLFAAEPPTAVSEHNTRDGRMVLRAIADALTNVWTRRACIMMEAMVVLCPEHVHTIVASGMNKDDVRQWLFDHAAVPLKDYEGDYAKGAEGSQFAPMYPKVTVDGVECYRKFRAPESIKLVVAGGTAGKFSAVIGSWVTGPRGSEIVTYPID